MLKNYKCLLFLSYLVCFGAFAETRPNRILQCLAKEEERIIKNKLDFSIAKLNQELVNELAASNDIMIKDSYVDDICEHPFYSPSVNLLRLLLIKENEVYDLTFDNMERAQKEFKLSYIADFRKQVPNIFVTYISTLNAQMPDAHCLQRHVPEIKKFNEKMKYLENEITTKSLIQDKKQIEAIFMKLRNVKEIKKLCENEIKRRKK